MSIENSFNTQSITTHYCGSGCKLMSLFLVIFLARKKLSPVMWDKIDLLLTDMVIIFENLI